ncbi:acyl-CoA dehydrogenase family protein [Aneurinibacillus danicus]|uniref:acyl-CoA dehydrogenase family protein n=1 Tax=Aneurinibacillus danicus TaxID=267746 RepID=UPI0027D96937|nr:acyl-CoA dehydrogenase family protein [Aneurinibacillus danicus]
MGFLFKDLQLPVIKLPEAAEKVRKEVRAFIKEELQKGTFEPHCDSWLGGFSPEFSRKLGERGWLGMTWPREYGGHGRSALERFIVTEELLAAGAPVAAHWIADRQTGPLLLRFGTESQRKRFLPKISAGEWYFAIGLSEPNTGSDLASVRTSAKKVENGWIINGSKIWTSGAHRAHYMIALCRTSLVTDERHEGMSQLIIDLASPGVTVRPIRLITGEHHFNEVILEEVFVPDEMVIGDIGNGWKQSMTELAYERSGPERFLSTFPLLVELVRVLDKNANERARISISELVAHLWTLRRMSLGVAGLLEKGIAPDIAASLVKDLGTQFESKIAETARLLYASVPSLASSSRFEVLLAQALLHSPGFTLRGGTTEILRGIIARGLGIR